MVLFGENNNNNKKKDKDNNFQKVPLPLCMTNSLVDYFALFLSINSSQYGTKEVLNDRNSKCNQHVLLPPINPAPLRCVHYNNVCVSPLVRNERSYISNQFYCVSIQVFITFPVWPDPFVSKINFSLSKYLTTADYFRCYFGKKKQL